MSVSAFRQLNAFAHPLPSLSFSLEKCRDLLSEADARQPRVSPCIQNLGFDVLAQIFGYYIDNKRNQDLPLRSKAPFNLSWVCRSWRRVVFDSEELWPLFDIRGEEDEESGLLLSFLSLYLAYSRDTPVDTRITLGHPFQFTCTEVDEVDEFSPICEALLPMAHATIAMLKEHKHRFRHIQLEFNILAPLAKQLRRRDYHLSDMPILEELDLFFPCDTRVGSRAENLTKLDLSVSKELRTLGLYGNFAVSFGRGTGWCGTFIDLTSVVLEGVSVSPAHPTLLDCYAVFLAAPNIVNFIGKICSRKDAEVDYSQFRRIVAHSLRMLAIGTTLKYDWAIRAFFHVVSAPNLEGLSVIFPRERSVEESTRGWTDFGIPEFIERSGCKLEYFVSQAKPMTDDELIDVLRLSPDLRSLKIEDGVNITARTITSLILSQDDDEGCVQPEFGLCPRLELIGLRRCDFEEGGNSVVRPFVGMLTSRWHSQGHRWLEEVYVEECGIMRALEDDRVRYFICDGLKLYMSEQIMPR